MNTDFISWGSPDYFLCLGILLFARGMDFWSTWLATPRLLLEANPLARRLGWKWGLTVNGVLCLGFAFWPLPAIIIATSSVLVAARNFQSAWLMRLLGEDAYRAWMSEQLRRVPVVLYLFCLGAQGFLYGLVGAALVWSSGGRLVPFAVGVGMIAYALAVVIYTLLAVWHIRRSPEQPRRAKEPPGGPCHESVLE